MKTPDAVVSTNELLAAPLGTGWQLLPPLSEEEYRALKADIAAQGVRIPLVVDADTGEVVEGHHRLRAWTELRAEGMKVPDYPKQVVHFANEDDRVAFVLAANLLRRHLSREQRADVVVRLRAAGWSLRRIADVVGVDAATALRDLAGVADATPALNESVTGRDNKRYPARRPRPAPTIFVQSDRDARRAAAALHVLGDDANGVIPLKRAEELARTASMDRIRAEAAEGPSEHSGETWKLRTGDFQKVLDDLADQSVDAIVTDPPYNNESVPLYEPLGALGLRVLKPGRLAAVYCGHLQLDREMELLKKGGLTYMWHGVIVLARRDSAGARAKGVRPPSQCPFLLGWDLRTEEVDTRSRLRGGSGRSGRAPTASLAASLGTGPALGAPSVEAGRTDRRPVPRLGHDRGRRGPRRPALPRLRHRPGLCRDDTASPGGARGRTLRRGEAGVMGATERGRVGECVPLAFSGRGR